MTQPKMITQVLFALLCLQSAFLLGARLPDAAAQEPEAAAEDSSETSTENTPSTPARVCQYFEMNEAQLKGKSHGEINTATATGDIKAFLSRESSATPAPTFDFELGQSISGKPTYWVQICLNEA
jgi:hypothetical protein